MRLIPIILVAGAGFAAANPLHVMLASKDVSPIRMGHAAGNVGATGASDFSDDAPKPKVRHLCKHMQKAVQGTASRLLAFIGIGGQSLAVSAPVAEGTVTRIQITTSGPVPHKLGNHPVGEPGRWPPSPARGGQGVPIWPHPMYMAQEDHLNAPFLHRAHRALMSLGPWEGRMVAFVLGCGIGVLARMFFVLTVLLVRAIRGNPVPDSEEETTILVYAGEIAPPYEPIDEKKDPDAVAVENRA